MSRFIERHGGHHDGHVIFIDVDDQNTLFESCHAINEWGEVALCGESHIIATRIPQKRADTVRRAAREFLATRGISR